MKSRVPTITNHSTEEEQEILQAKILADGLTQKECIELSVRRLPALPSDASSAYKAIHKILSDAEKNDASAENKRRIAIYQKQLKLAYMRKRNISLMRDSYIVKLNSDERNSLLNKQPSPDPHSQTSIYKFLHQKLLNASKDDASDEDKTLAEVIRDGLVIPPDLNEDVLRIIFTYFIEDAIKNPRIRNVKIILDSLVLASTLFKCRCEAISFEVAMRKIQEKNIVSARRLLELFPNLLLKDSVVSTFQGKRFTPLQLAYVKQGQEGVWCHWLAPVFTRLPYGRAAMFSQLNEDFRKTCSDPRPDSWHKDLERLFDENFLFNQTRYQKKR